MILNNFWGVDVGVGGGAWLLSKRPEGSDFMTRPIFSLTEGKRPEE